MPRSLAIIPGSRESLDYLEQKVTQTAPCLEGELKEEIEVGRGWPREEIRGREAGEEKQQQKHR